MKSKIIPITILLIAAIAFAQPSIRWFSLDDSGTMPEITIPDAEPTRGVEFVEIGDTTDIGERGYAPDMSAERARARAGLEARSRATMEQDTPPIIILDLTIPRSRTAIAEEELVEGHILRNDRIYMKLDLTFTDITPGTAILGLAPLDEDARIDASSTIQEAKAAIIDEYVALSRTTPDDEIYIDITDIVDAYHDGDIGSQFALYPLNPREKFEIPEESRDSHGRFDIVLTVE